MRHLSRISLQRPAYAVMAPDYPPGLLGLLLRWRDDKKGIVY